MPRPEDVLANCRVNIATCLIKLERFEEARSTLNLAEELSLASLRPIIDNLRGELETGEKKSKDDAIMSEEKDKKADSPDESPEDPFALPDIEDLGASPNQTEMLTSDELALDEDDFGLPDLDDILNGEVASEEPAAEESSTEVMESASALVEAEVPDEQVQSSGEQAELGRQASEADEETLESSDQAKSEEESSGQVDDSGHESTATNDEVESSDEPVEVVAEQVHESSRFCGGCFSRVRGRS